MVMVDTPAAAGSWASAGGAILKPESLAPAAAGAETDAPPELGAVRAQVEQARGILADAVERVCRCFRTMETESTLQRNLMAALMGSMSASPGPVDQDGARLTRPGAAVPNDVSGAQPVDFHAFAVALGAFLCDSAAVLTTLSQQNAESLRRMDSMVSQLDGVFSLVRDINGIADETYILAVNAQIEAARVRSSAESGNGFSVIAANVRELSQKTRQFNSQIADQVGKARATVHEVRQTVATMAVQHEEDALSGAQSSDSLMRQLRQFREFMNAGMARANTSAVRVAEATSEAITAMQFEDILNQLLMSIRHHADRLAPSAVDAGSLLSPPGEVVFPSSEPVQQRDMATGTVELF
jgi:methyl-accepting chemotaxis protein